MLHVKYQSDFSPLLIWPLLTTFRNSLAVLVRKHGKEDRHIYCNQEYTHQNIPPALASSNRGERTADQQMLNICSLSTCLQHGHFPVFLPATCVTSSRSCLPASPTMSPGPRADSTLLGQSTTSRVGSCFPVTISCQHPPTHLLSNTQTTVISCVKPPK